MEKIRQAECLLAFIHLILHDRIYLVAKDPDAHPGIWILLLMHYCVFGAGCCIIVIYHHVRS